MKKILSMMLVIMMLISAIPTAYAGWGCAFNCEGADIADCNKCDGIQCTVCGHCSLCADTNDCHCKNCDPNHYSHGTQVVYEATGTESYTITVPALLTPGAEGTVTLNGVWADNRIITVTADATVTLSNSIWSADQKILDIDFTDGNGVYGISKRGNNTQSQTFTQQISVANIENALFGVWSGRFNYNVALSDATKKPMFSIMHKPTGTITQPKETFTMYGCDLIEGLGHTAEYEGGFVKEFPAGEYIAEIPGVLSTTIKKDFSAEFYGDMSTIEFDRALLNVTAEELGTYMVYTEWPDGSVTGIDFTMETANGISAACITYKYVDEVGEDSDWGAGPYLIWVYDDSTKTFTLAMGDITAYDGMWIYVDASQVLLDAVLEEYQNQ